MELTVTTIGFGIVKQLDDYLYFFAAISGTVGPGIKVAKVPENSVADRSKVRTLPLFISQRASADPRFQYTYWNGVSWAATPPVATNPAANMFNYSGSYGYGPASGDIYFNTYCSSPAITLSKSNSCSFCSSTKSHIPFPSKLLTSHIQIMSGWPSSSTLLSTVPSDSCTAQPSISWDPGPQKWICTRRVLRVGIITMEAMHIRGLAPERTCC